MPFENIPEELRTLDQWVVWRYEDIGAAKPTKVPYDCITNNLANVNDRNTWHNFIDATKAIASYSGIGFVFSGDDCYSFIDLDDTMGDQTALNRQIEIYRQFDSYSEISPSGKGLHIIVRGVVPAGRRRSHIEIYSSQRYATFTGICYPNKDDPKPIKDCQDKLMQLWNQMGSGPATHIYQGDEKEKFNDQQIIDQGLNAVNGDKFKILLEGKWQGTYPSQSEADLAFINIITFYSHNREQTKRIYWNSILGNTDKKRKRIDYVEWMINKSFDRMLPPIDFDGFKIQLEFKLAEGKKQTIVSEPELPLGKEGDCHTVQLPGPHNDLPHQSDNATDGAIEIPPGLLGELAQFIYLAAPRPVPEIALAGAIGLMAGIVGRAYNISGTGLNQYVLLLADTGTGKEAMASGIDKLMNAIRLSVPTSTSYIGPSEIASGQALIKHINKFSQCFVSILGEFGLRLQSMSNVHASSSEVSLRRILLDLYNKSGHGQVWRGTIYADRDKNVEATSSPAFTILGESTPERFYGALNEEMISEGLLPRFLIMEYLGARPPLNKNAMSVNVSMPLYEKFSAVVAQCESVIYSGKVINVQSETIAQQMLDKFDEYATSLINKSDKDIVKQLWNRAHIKALKLAALVAVGVNMVSPLILPQYVEWAIAIVRHDIKALSVKFESGLIGLNSSEIKQMSEAIRCIKEYVMKPWEKVKTYCPSCFDLHNEKILPHEYMTTRVGMLASFKNDRFGRAAALKRVIQTLIDDGKLEEVTKYKWFQDKFNRQSKRAFLIKPEILDSSKAE